MVLRGGGGEVGELRRLLARAAADDDARSAALDAICECHVFAATAGGGEALRTLTNPGGQKAMPLFSGRDTLEAAAKQFKWASTPGAQQRELSAREAMQGALSQGVEFVVFDVGAEHCVEFARDEVALILAAKQARERPAASAAQASAGRADAGKPAVQVVRAGSAAESNPRKPAARRLNTTPAAMPAARARNSTPAGAQRSRPPATPPMAAGHGSLPPDHVRKPTPPPIPAAQTASASDRARKPTPPPIPVAQSASAPEPARKPPPPAPLRPQTPAPMPAARVSFPVASDARSAAPPAAERTRLETPGARPAARLSAPAAARTAPGFAPDPGRPMRVSVPSPAGGTAIAGSLPLAAEHPARAALLPPMGSPSVHHADARLPPTGLPAAGTAVGTVAIAAKGGLAGELPTANSVAPLPSSVAGVSGASDSFAPRVPRAKPNARHGPKPPSLSAPVEPLPAQVDAVTGLGFAHAEALPDALPQVRASSQSSDGLPEVKPGIARAPSPAQPAASAVAQVTEPAAVSAQEIPPPQAATEKATLKQKAMKGVDEVAGRSLKTAAKAFAAMLGGDGDKRAAASKAEPAPPAADVQDAVDAGEEPQEPAHAEGALRPLEVGLSDAVQGAIADALRAYPEVEWACEVSDGTEVPVVGVRVSLSFTNRVGEIEAALLRAASSRGTSVRVLMLNEPALMREARAHGNTFFPWRKRPARK